MIIVDLGIHKLKRILTFGDSWVEGGGLDDPHTNKLFIKELKLLINKLDYSEKEFNINMFPIELKKHLINNNLFKIRYFIK